MLFSIPYPERFIQACNCIGITGNISIIRDFYGYGGIPGPFTGSLFSGPAPGIETLSLLQQVRLIKNNLHLRIHIKIVVPAGTVFNPTIDQQVSAMRQAYAGIGIAVVVRSIETLALPVDFFDILAEYCSMSIGASSETVSLFQNLNYVPTRTEHSELGPLPPHDVTDSIFGTEIVVYFVSTVSLYTATGYGPLNGCAAYPVRAVIERIIEPDPGTHLGTTRKRVKLLTCPGAVIAGNNAVFGH